MKRKIVTTIAAFSTLFMLSGTMPGMLSNAKATEVEKQGAKVERPKSSQQVSRNAVEKEKLRASRLKAELNQQAVKAVADTILVLDLLDQGKSKEALEKIKDVIGELEVVLAANKDAKLVPVRTYSVVVDLKMGVEQVKDALKQVKGLLDDGKVQEARILLSTLQSEIDIVVEQLPLATYPDAMKLASKYIVDGKLDQAKSIITTALNSMVVETIVIPLPLIRAYDLVDEASKIAKTNKDQALKYLDNARKQLKIAKALGYVQGSETEYQDLHKRIDDIEKEIQGSNKPEAMFQELLNKLRKLKENITSRK